MGGSPAELGNLALLGVALLIVGLLPRAVEGGTISTGVMASTHGLLEFSSATVAALFRALLSFLLSRMLFDSPLTCFALAKPAVLDPEFDSLAVLELILVVSILSSRFGERPLPDTSSSTQPAGVGGTGPRFDIVPGLRVGGETILFGS